MCPSCTDPIQHAWRDGLNPGGEVMFVQVPDDLADKFPADCRNRLLSRAEAEAIA
jgi:hypothetical protein